MGVVSTQWMPGSVLEHKCGKMKHLKYQFSIPGICHTSFSTNVTTIILVI